MVIVGLILWGSHKVLIKAKADLGNERLFARQLIMLGLSFAAILAIALALPISEGSKNQLIALIGLLVSGVFAFSSSTLFANLMAGIMLRITKPFKTGDFISIENYFGRIVERGLLDTEIQTENRELVALPNTFMIANPVSVTRSSGTIVSTTLSLGYDIHHKKIESVLIEAATQCGLEEPFVQLIELGDFSITYKLSGMLTDVKSLLTARSNLSRYVLDNLHGKNIEIVSPTFMNQRGLAENTKIIPVKEKSKKTESDTVVEAVMFDKADKAEQLEKERKALREKIKEHKLELEEASKEDKADIQAAIDECKEQLKGLGNLEEDDDIDKVESEEETKTTGRSDT